MYICKYIHLKERVKLWGWSAGKTYKLVQCVLSVFCTPNIGCICQTTANKSKQ